MSWMKRAQPLTQQITQQYRQDFLSDPHSVAMKNAAAHNDMKSLAAVPEAARQVRSVFSNQVETMAATNQKSSGRCWIFAGLNLLREIVGKRCGIESFELSQNYVAFWDKYEKANYFYESILDTADRDIDDRTVQFILSNGIQDGGQWDMLVNLVKKYGLVPKDAMPETHHSSATGPMNWLLNMQLRRNAMLLRDAAAQGRDTAAMKEQMMSEIYRLLCIGFSTPPEKADFEYCDKDKVFHRELDLTPKDFYDKYVGLALEDYVSIIHAPTRDKPFERLYTVAYTGNVVGGRDIRYLNLPMEQLKSLCIRQLTEGEAVWFGSDCSFWRDALPGVFDDKSYDFQSAYGMSFEMEKGDMLQSRASAMNHAMVITGVNLTDGRPDRWRIENSWGDKAGLEGYFAMSDSWFDRMVYQAVIHKRYLSPAQRAALDQEPIVLKPWDPMGTLAD